MKKLLAMASFLIAWHCGAAPPVLLFDEKGEPLCQIGQDFDGERGTIGLEECRENQILAASLEVSPSEIQMAGIPWGSIGVIAGVAAVSCHLGSDSAEHMTEGDSKGIPSFLFSSGKAAIMSAGIYALFGASVLNRVAMVPLGAIGRHMLFGAASSALCYLFQVADEATH